MLQPLTPGDTYSESTISDTILLMRQVTVLFGGNPFEHPLSHNTPYRQDPIEELRPLPAPIFLGTPSLESTFLCIFFCNAVVEILQLRSSFYHLFKKFSLYLHV